MRLTKASKWLKDKHVRLLTPFETRLGERFAVNEILRVDGVWRDRVHVCDLTIRERGARRIPVGYFELAEDLGPPPAKRLPPAPKRSTWVEGKLLIQGDRVFVGGKAIAPLFTEFDGKKVRLTLKVVEESV